MVTGQSTLRPLPTGDITGTQLLKWGNREWYKKSGEQYVTECDIKSDTVWIVKPPSAVEVIVILPMAVIV
jgi:hypothetical protein